MIFVAGLILLLALFGGVQFYFQQSILMIGVFIGWGIITWAAWLVVTHRSIIPFWLSLKWLFVAVLFSILANLNVYETTLSRLWLYILALAVLITSRHYLDDEKILTGIYWTGWLWPGIYWLARASGWQDNRNIVAAWSIIFIVAGLQKKDLLYLLLHLSMMLILGCRGAILGVTIAILIFNYHLRSRLPKFAWMALCGLLVALIIWRGTSLRTYYWFVAMGAFFTAPIFGIGPGGLKINHIIAEPGGGYQIHAHNALVTWIAETGLVGLICLAIAGWQIYKSRFLICIQCWQAAILAGVAAHSLVDEPLWWPGPLLAVALIIGCSRKGILWNRIK